MFRIACGDEWAYVSNEATALLWLGRGRRVQCHRDGLWVAL